MPPAAAEGPGPGEALRRAQARGRRQLPLRPVQVSALGSPTRPTKLVQNSSSQLVFGEGKYSDFIILYYSGTSRFLILFFFPLLPAKYSLFSGTRTSGKLVASAGSHAAILTGRLRRAVKVGSPTSPAERFAAEGGRLGRRDDGRTRRFAQGQKPSSRVTSTQVCLHQHPLQPPSSGGRVAPGETKTPHSNSGFPTQSWCDLREVTYLHRFTFYRQTGDCGTCLTTEGTE